jgi:hypothetical protein
MARGILAQDMLMKLAKQLIEALVGPPAGS